MSESERTLVRQGSKQRRRPSVAEMRARIGVLETELAAAHEREATTAEVLRQRTRSQRELWCPLVTNLRLQRRELPAQTRSSIEPQPS